MEIGPMIEVNPTILFKIPCSKPWSISGIWFDKNAFNVGLTISDKAAIGIMAKTNNSNLIKPNENNAIIPNTNDRDIRFFVESLSKNCNRIINAWTINNKNP